MNTIDTAAEAPTTKQWYALRTAPRHEKRVRDRIQHSHFECLLPLQRTVTKWRNGVRATVETPLFPTYLFVCLHRHEYWTILNIPGVNNFVGVTGVPWPVPGDQIEMLRTLPQLNAVAARLPVAGDTVRIVSGPLSGITGTVLRGSGPLRVVLTVSVIWQGVAVEVGFDDIEMLIPHMN